MINENQSPKNNQNQWQSNNNKKTLEMDESTINE